MAVRRDMRGVVRAEMFGQLTTGLETAWNKLKGEGFPFSPFFFFKLAHEPTFTIYEYFF